MKCMSMPLEEYFAKANSLMEKNSPLSFDTEIINRLKKLGVGPGLDLKQIENGAEMCKNLSFFQGICRSNCSHKQEEHRRYMVLF